MSDELDPIPLNRLPIQALQKGSALAEGGFAKLWTAGHAQLGEVVLRVLKDEFRFNRKMRGRFRQGVEIRRQCGRHPNIVQYRAHGGTLFTCPFEVCEYVRGSNLKRLIFDRNPEVTRQPLGILRQAAAAMMHIHQIGYLHLDIKPENYLVEFVDDKPVVKLTDFDLCLPVGDREAPRGFGGSLMYLAPEYLVSKEISISTDVFAFGVMAFNLCTGQMPFIGSVESLLRSDNYRIIFPQSIHNSVTPRLEAFILRCLAKDPGKRFRDGADLFFNLEQIVRDETKERQRAQMAR